MSFVVCAASRAGHELMEFMRRNEIKPFRNFLVPLAQVSISSKTSFHLLIYFCPYCFCLVLFVVVVVVVDTITYFVHINSVLMHMPGVGIYVHMLKN